jgi:hypothetical protein
LGPSGHRRGPQGVRARDGPLEPAKIFDCPFPFTERGGPASARCRVISATAGEVAAWVRTERTARKLYRTRDEAKADMFDYIERFYNPKREQGGISLSGCHPNRVMQAMLTASTIGFFMNRHKASVSKQQVWEPGTKPIEVSAQCQTAKRGSNHLLCRPRLLSLKPLTIINATKDEAVLRTVTASS